MHEKIIKHEEMMILPVEKRRKYFRQCYAIELGRLHATGVCAWSIDSLPRMLDTIMLQFSNRRVPSGPAFDAVKKTSRIEDTKSNVRISRILTSMRLYEEIWQDWYAADAAYQDALTEAYGKRAGDMRYRTDVDHPETVVVARAAFHELSREIHEYWKSKGCVKTDSVGLASALKHKQRRMGIS